MMDVISERAFDSHPRSIVKAISWRTLGSIDTFVLSWIITGNFVWAGSIASFEVITKMMLYYLHERGWSHIKWGIVRVRANRPAEPQPARPKPVVAATESRWTPEEEIEEIPALVTANARRHG